MASAVVGIKVKTPRSKVCNMLWEPSPRHCEIMNYCILCCSVTINNITYLLGKYYTFYPLQWCFLARQLQYLFETDIVFYVWKHSILFFYLISFVRVKRAAKNMSMLWWFVIGYMILALFGSGNFFLEQGLGIPRIFTLLDEQLKHSPPFPSSSILRRRLSSQSPSSSVSMVTAVSDASAGVVTAAWRKRKTLSKWRTWKRSWRKRSPSPSRRKKRDSQRRESRGSR